MSSMWNFGGFDEPGDRGGPRDAGGTGFWLVDVVEGVSIRQPEVEELASLFLIPGQVGEPRRGVVYPAVTEGRTGIRRIAVAEKKPTAAVARFSIKLLFRRTPRLRPRAKVLGSERSIKVRYLLLVNSSSENGSLKWPTVKFPTSGTFLT